MWIPIPELPKPPQVIHGIRRFRATHDLRPKARIGRMQGYPQRGKPLLFNALPVVLSQVGEGNEVTEQKRQPVIIVTYVKGPAHPRGKLGNKAEAATVIACPNRIKHRVNKRNTHEIIRVLFNLKPLPGSILLLYVQRNMFCGTVKPEVDFIPEYMPAHRDYPVPGRDSKIFSQAARFNLVHQSPSALSRQSTQPPLRCDSHYPSTLKRGQGKRGSLGTVVVPCLPRNGSPACVLAAPDGGGGTEIPLSAP